MSITSSPLRRTGPGPAPAPAGSRKTTLLGAAIAAVAAAGFGIVALGSSSDSGSAGDTVKVVVAQRAVPQGSALTGLADGTLKLRTVSASDLTPGALTSVSALDGKVATRDLARGDQLTAKLLADDAGVVSDRLPEGQRAVTLPVDAAHGMAGDIKASDRVDVYGSYQVNQGNSGQARPVLKVIAQDVRVLRAPAAGKAGAAAAGTEVTLSLDPATATQAAFTADNGKLWLAARPMGSDQTTRPDLVTVESLLFGVKPIVAAKPERVSTGEVAR